MCFVARRYLTFTRNSKFDEQLKKMKRKDRKCHWQSSTLLKLLFPAQLLKMKNTAALYAKFETRCNSGDIIAYMRTFDRLHGCHVLLTLSSGQK